MRRIAITGAGGLIGWHMQAWLAVQPDTHIVPVSRATWARPEALAAQLADCDAVVHLAAMNRGEEDEIYEVNVGLAGKLAEALARASKVPHVLHASSIQAGRDNAYGRSKRTATIILSEWAERAGARYTDMVLPNVFGEGGRPFHNSVVATFCHQLATGAKPRIEIDTEIEFLHAHETARGIGRLIDEEGGASGLWRPEGQRLKVSALLDRLGEMDAGYRAHMIPDLRDSFDLDLFNTYRSYRFPDAYPTALKTHTDLRGTLVEAVREANGGQVHYSSTRPGLVRGEHFHFRKVERFLVIAGEGEIAIRRIGSRTVTRFRVGGEKPAYVDIPTIHTHNLRNVGQGELITLFWAHEPYNPAAPDTYREPVEPTGQANEAPRASMAGQ